MAGPHAAGASGAAAAFGERIARFGARGMERWDRTKGETRGDRRDRGERDDGAVDRDVVHTRQVGRCEVAQEVHSPGGESEPGGSADRREQGALGEQLSNESRASGAERDACRKLAASSGGSRKQ